MTVRLVPHNTTGVILRAYLIGQQLPVESALPPPNAGTPLEFDEESNAALWVDLQDNVQRKLYTLLAGVLRKNAVIQTIQPDSNTESDRKAIAGAITALQAYFALSVANRQLGVNIQPAFEGLARIVRYMAKKEGLF